MRLIAFASQNNIDYILKVYVYLEIMDRCNIKTEYTYIIKKHFSSYHYYKLKLEFGGVGGSQAMHFVKL